ncbi:glycosyltransferase family 2 protein [Larkinella soli]|uniref:glycosyltransferase family 2 protein n=1 Tax=Larkinella soli TaxID=1770527 RepID=UPI000FFCC313|nr:glycosyltransferase family A protein [Larkinella soli]
MAADEKPLVSVITAFFNEERLLSESIESVLAQTYPHWELWLIDDGSSDGSTRIARDYAARFPERIFYTEHENHQNHGLSASRNHGIRQARGKLIALLDADDVWLPVKLEKQVEIFRKHPDIAMICEASTYWYTWEDGNNEDETIRVGTPAQDRAYAPPQLSVALYPLGKGDAPVPSGMIMTKESLVRNRLFEDSYRGIYQMYEDQALLCKMYLNEKIYISSDSNNLYRQRVGSLVQSIHQDGKYHKVRRYFLEWQARYIEEHQLNFPEVNKLLAVALMPYTHPLLHRFYSLPRLIRSALRRTS